MNVHLERGHVMCILTSRLKRYLERLCKCAYSSDNMTTTDDFIDQLLAELPDKQSDLHTIVQNILDEPTPKAV